MNEVTYLAALRVEALALRLGARGARVVTFGMGERAAEAAVARLLQLPAEPVVLFGYSGALHESQRPGDLVVATELSLVGHEETVALFGTEKIAKTLEEGGLRVASAPVVTSRRLVKGDAARSEAASRGAVAVDMESWFFAPLVRDRRFAVIRSILDVPGREVISASTPLAAVPASLAIKRAARLMQNSAVLLEVPTHSEQAGES